MAEGDVAVEEPCPAEEAVVGPDADDGNDVWELGEEAEFGVVEDAEKGEECESLVKVEESFVEGVADGGRGLEEHDE